MPNSRLDIGDATGRARLIAGLNAHLEYILSGVPANAISGFAPSALAHNYAGVPGTSLYLNVGTKTSAVWVPLDGLILGNLPRATVATALTTVGAGTITAAGIVGGLTTRGGGQSATAFTDTTDTAALIVAAIGSYAVIGQSFFWEYQNNTDAPATLTGGTGVTVSGITVVPKNSSAVYLVTYTAANTVTIVGVEMNPGVYLPASQYVTQAYQTATLAAGDITGANWCNFDNTGTTPGTITTRTATLMFGDLPNAQVGFNYMLAIRNSSGSANTLTLAAGVGVTLTGTMTVAQNVTRLFNVKFPSATTCTIQSMGILAAGA